MYREINRKKILEAHKARKKNAFKSLMEKIDKNIILTEWLLKKYDWDLFMIVFMSADHAGHGFWEDKGEVRKVYEKLDKAVGKLFALAGRK